MVEGAGEQFGRRQEVRHKNYLFYADDVMIALLEPVWIKGVFSILVGLFNRVGLNNNVGNIVEMVCRSFQAEVTWSEAAYNQ